MFTSNNRVRVEDQRVEKDAENQKLLNHLFIRLSAKDMRFIKVDFRYSIFDMC